MLSASLMHWHVQEECRALITECMARGNAQLALSIYGTMCRVGPGSSGASAARHREQLAWPPATLETVSAVVSVGYRALLSAGHANSAVVSSSLVSQCQLRGVPGDSLRRSAW